MKKVDCFPSPNDERLDELLKIISIVLEWENESLSNKKEFISIQSYEDFCCIVFAKIGICSKYLHDDKSLLLVPGCSGSDVVDHYFGHMRQTNTQSRILEYRQAIARESDIGPINNIFSVNSKSNTSGFDVYACEAFSLMKPKINLKKKKKST